MRLRSRKALAAVVAAVVCAVAALAGSADAAKRPAHGALLRAAAAYIGVSRGELVKDARAGQTLAQIATAHKKTVAGLKSAMLAALKSRFDAAVSAKKLTPAQAQARLARADKLLDRIVNARLGRAALRPTRARLLNISARYIGMTPKALRAELKAGSSLAQVAVDQGKTASGLKGALLKPFEQRLDKARVAGRISAADAQSRLSRISARLDRIINRTS
jgi:uncharacterized tellurite resistance protein B-like protein